MSACAAPLHSLGFIGSFTRFIDCQAEMLGTGAWAALSIPGSSLSLVLTGFLTIFIALIGYNLLLGQGPTVRTGTIAFIKIGIVLALATSWPAYRTLVYDLVTDGPSQLVSEIARPTALPGADGTLVQRLDIADSALVRLGLLGPGNPIAVSDQRVPHPFAGFDAFALGGSRILFLVAAIAGLGVVKIVAALMLALGPFFIAFLLFDATRSLFEGWVRVLGGAAMGAIGVSVVLGLQLALMEPWLSGVLARRMAQEPLPAMPTELVVITTVFAILVVAVLAASAWLARAFRFPVVVWGQRDIAVPQPAAQTATAAALGPHSAASSEERGRAAAVADVLVAMQRRESAGRELAGVNRLVVAANAPSVLARDGETAARTATPLGRSMRRRTRTRASASADRRDSAR